MHSLYPTIIYHIIYVLMHSFLYLSKTLDQKNAGNKILTFNYKFNYCSRNGRNPFGIKHCSIYVHNRNI